jgi:O-antigen/teichoic acid export membrane protein
MSSLSRSLMRNSVLQVGGKVLGTLFGLITFYFLLHFFGVEGYGFLTVAITYVSVFAIIVDFGLTLTTTQMISEKGANEERILGNLLSLRIISAVLFLALAPLSALFIPEINQVFVLVCIFSAATFFGSVAQSFVGVFQKRISLTVPVLGETLNRTLVLVAIVLIGLFHPTLALASVAFVLGGAAQFAVMLFGTSRLVRLRPAFDAEVWKTFFIRSWPIGLSIFFNLIYLKGDIIFMSLLGVSEENIGQYGSAYKVVDVMTVIPVTFMGLMLPLLAAAWSERSKGKFEKHLRDTFDVFSILAIPFAIGAILLGVPLMTFVKPDLILAGQILAVLGPAASIVFFNSLYGHVIVAINRQRMMTWAYLFVAVVATVLYVVYIPVYGAWAAAWVTVVAESLIGLLTFAVVTSVSKTLPSLRMFVRASLATALMAGAILILPLPHVILQILAGILVYALALTALGGPSPRSLFKLFLPEKPSVTP